MGYKDKTVHQLCNEGVGGLLVKEAYRNLYNESISDSDIERIYGVIITGSELDRTHPSTLIAMKIKEYSK